MTAGLSVFGVINDGDVSRTEKSRLPAATTKVSHRLGKRTMNKSKTEAANPGEAARSREPVGSTAVLADLDAEAKLMRSAQRFGLAFSENRMWGDDVKRLEYTLTAWRELALAALAYAETVHSANVEGQRLPQ